MGHEDDRGFELHFESQLVVTKDTLFGLMPWTHDLLAASGVTCGGSVVLLKHLHHGRKQCNQGEDERHDGLNATLSHPVPVDLRAAGRVIVVVHCQGSSWLARLCSAGKWSVE